MTRARRLAFIFCVGCSLLALKANAQRAAEYATKTVADAYGVAVTQQDIDLHDAAGSCNTYSGGQTPGGQQLPPDSNFWPQPCTELINKYEQTGAKSKYDEAYRRKRMQELSAVKRTLQ